MLLAPGCFDAHRLELLAATAQGWQRLHASWRSVLWNAGLASDEGAFAAITHAMELFQGYESTTMDIRTFFYSASMQPRAERRGKKRRVQR